MATKKEIKDRLRALGLENEYGYRAEAKLIPESLEAGEHLRAITSGIRESRRWFIILTEGRLLMLTKPTLGRPHLVAVQRDEVKGIEGHRGLLFGSLTVETAEGVYSFSNVLKKSLPHFLAEFNARTGLDGR